MTIEIADTTDVCRYNALGPYKIDEMYIEVGNKCALTTLTDDSKDKQLGLYFNLNELKNFHKLITNFIEYLEGENNDN